MAPHAPRYGRTWTTYPASLLTQFFESVSDDRAGGTSGCFVNGLATSALKSLVVFVSQALDTVRLRCLSAPRMVHPNGRSLKTYRDRCAEAVGVRHDLVFRGKVPGSLRDRHGQPQ